MENTKKKTIEKELLEKGVDKKKIEEWKREIFNSEIVPLEWSVKTSDKLIKEDLPKTEFIIEKLIPKGGICMLAGNPGSNKSWIALQMCKEIGMESSMLFDRFTITPPNKILYIDEESAFQEIKRRWEKLSPGHLTMVDFMAMNGFKIDNQEQREALLNFCDCRNYNVIIFDSLRAIYTGNENDSQAIQELMNYLKEFSRRNITLLLIHHNRKESPLISNSPTQSLRGSTAILGALDSLITIEQVKTRDNNDLEIVLSQSKLRQGIAAKSFRIIMTENDENAISFNFMEELQDENKEIFKVKDTIIEFIQDHGNEESRKSIVEYGVAAGYHARTIDRAIKELEIDKILVFSKFEKRCKYFKVASPKDDGFEKI